MNNLTRVSNKDYLDFNDYDGYDKTHKLKVHFDGSSFVGTSMYTPPERFHYDDLKQKGGCFCGGYSSFKKPFIRGYRSKKTEKQEFLVKEIKQAISGKMPRNQRVKYFENVMREQFGNFDGLTDYVEKHLKNVLNGINKRKKLFLRKLKLNRWTHFCTFTYSNKKVTEKEFKCKLKKCLSNLACRYGWRYMGVWERGGENNRLHFHAIIYIPIGCMVGKVIECKDYDIINGVMQITHQNTFFNERFGRSDFDIITQESLDDGSAARYILKYVTKQETQLVYSRYVPSALIFHIKDKNIDVIADWHYIPKYIISNDVLDWEKDIYGYDHKYLKKPRQKSQQISFNDTPVELSILM